MSDNVYRRWTRDQPSDLKREHCVSVRMNDDELLSLDEKRGQFKRGEYLRLAFFNALPPQIPELNIKVWQELARASANLNQLARHANSTQIIEVNELREQLSAFRNALIGAEDA